MHSRLLLDRLRTWLKKSSSIFLFILFYHFFIFITNDVHAQIASSANYTFTTGTTGNLSLDINSNTINTAVQADLANVGLSSTLSTMDIGFDFWFMGTRYVQVTPGVRGFLGLGALAPSATVSLNLTGSVAPFLAPFINQNTSTPTRGKNLRTQLVGTAPNRCFVLEWNVATGGSTSSAPDMTYQARLYESTGVIEYVYGSMNIGPNTISTTQATIGWTNVVNLDNTLVCVNNLATYTNTTKAGLVNNYLVNQALAGPVTNLASGRYFRWTPPVPVAPTVLTFSGTTSTTQTISWNDNSLNEFGFAIYRSDDGGINYNFITQTAQNVNTFTQSFLSPNTTYYYKVYAVSEAGMGAALAGSAATTAGSTIASTLSGGNWSSTSTWTGGVVPTIADNVTIIDGSTVTIDIPTATCNNLTVGQGTSGILTYSSVSPSALFVNGNVTIAVGGTFTAGTSNIQTHALTIGGFPANGALGSLTANGTFNMDFATAPSVGAAVITTFGGQGNGVVSGTGTTCQFYTVVVNKGFQPLPWLNPILDVIRVITMDIPVSTGTRLTITSGTFKISSATSITPYFGAQTICAVAGRLWLNNASASISQVGVTTLVGAGNPTVAGELRIDNGTFAYGSGNNTLTFTTTVVGTPTYGSRLVMNGGTLNMYGAISFASSNAIYFNMSGGAINVYPQAANFLPVATTIFTIGSSTTVNWSGGIVTIVDPHNAAGGISAGFSSGGTKLISGGTLQIGDGTSGKTSGALGNTTGFLIALDMPVYNLLINNRIDLSNTRICRTTGTGSFGSISFVNNNATINTNGYLMCSSGGTTYSLRVYGSVINNGTLAGVEPGSTAVLGTLNFCDTAGTDNLSGTGTFYNLATLQISPVFINAGSANVVSLSQTNTLVVNTLSYLAGTLNPNGKLTIGRPGFIPVVTIGGIGIAVAPPQPMGSIPNFDNTSYNTSYSYSSSNISHILGSYNEMSSSVNTVYNLTVNNYTGLTINKNLTVVNTLTMTMGNINLGSNTLTLGSGLTNVGTLTYTMGSIITGTGGKFARWFNTTAAPTSGITTSQFPLGNTSGEPRTAYVFFSAANALSTGGTIAISHNSQAGTSSMTSYSDGALTGVDTRSNSNWRTTTGNGITLGTGTVSLSLVGTSALYVLTSVANVTVNDASGTALGGTYSAGTGTVNAPQANRTGMTFAQLTANQLYLGSPTANVTPMVIAVASGNWGDGTTWNTGVAPIVNDNVTIPYGMTIAVAGTTTPYTCKNLFISSGGTLNASANTLTVSGNMVLTGNVTNYYTYARVNVNGGILNVTGIATGGGITLNANGVLNLTSGTINVSTNTDCSKQLNLISGGILNVIGGNLNLYGYFTVVGTFNQTAGTISIYPNGGTAATSAPLHSYSQTAISGQCNGGTIIIVDPPFAASAQSIFLSTSSLTYYTGSHTFQFGDGVSTKTGSSFFRAETYSSSYVPIQNIIINGGLSGSGRETVSSINSGSYGTFIKGTMTINPGAEYVQSVANYFAIGTAFINNGVFSQTASTTSYPLHLGAYTSSFMNPCDMTISGTGVFRNSLTASTANFNDIKIITNNVPNRVIFNFTTANTTIYVANSLNLTSGQLDIGNDTLVLGNTSTMAAGTLTYNAGSQILTTNGVFARVFPTSGLPTGAGTGLAGHFPMGRFNALTNSIERRDAYIYFSSATALATPGIIGMIHQHGNGISSITPFTDGALTIDSRTNSKWIMGTPSTATPTLTSGQTIGLKLSGQGLGITPITIANTSLSLATSVAGGIYSAGTYTVVFPEFNRTGMVVSDINNTLYGSIPSSNNASTFIAVANGNWGSGTTWSTGTIPTVTDKVLIQSPYTVILGSGATYSCDSLVINTGATLIANANTLTVTKSIVNNGTVLIGSATINVNLGNTSLYGINNVLSSVFTLNGGTVNIGPSGGGMATLTQAGTLNINAGTLNVNGNVSMTSVLNMPGGVFNIDGNNNTFGGSVAAGTNLLNIAATTTNVTGGTIRIIDPPYSGTALALNVPGGVAAWTNNSLVFGNGTSTDANQANFGIISGYTQTSGFGVSTLSNVGNVFVSGNGTGRHVGLNATSFTCSSLFINSGSEFRTTQNNVSSSALSLTGNLVNNGTLTTSQGSALNMAGIVPQSISGSGVFRVDTASAIAANINNLGINNSSLNGVDMSGISNMTIGGFSTLSAQLNLTAGPLNIGNKILTLGTSALISGTLTVVSLTSAVIFHTAGGGFSRWISATATPTTIGATSQYPLGILLNGTVLRRDFYAYFSAAAITTGGQFTVSHTNVSGNASVTSFSDGSLSSVDTRSNSYWSVINSGVTTSGTVSATAQASGLAYPLTLANITLMDSAGALAGTYVAGSNTQTDPRVNRTGMSIANITASPKLYIGIPSGSYAGNIFSVTSGNWSNTSTWSTGTVPTLSDNVTISANHTINLDAIGQTRDLKLIAGSIMNISANTLTCNTVLANAGVVNVTGGTLTILGNASTTGFTNTGSLLLGSGTINVGISPNFNRSFNSSGTFAVTGGTFNMNGNINISAGTFNMSGGTINIDGNDGSTIAGSVASGTNIFNIISTTQSVTGGTIVIIDPPFIGTALAFSYGTSTNVTWTGNTLQFGNGSSTNAGSSTTVTVNANPATQGFGVSTSSATGTGRLTLANVLINATNSGNCRFVSVPASTSNSLDIGGNLTINAGGELRTLGATSVVSGGINIGGNIVNNGRLIIASNTTLGLRLNASTATANPQTLSGTGVYCYDTTVVSGSGFSNLLINNTSVGGVTVTALGNITIDQIIGTISGTLTLTAGPMNMSSNSLTIGGSAARPGILAGTFTGNNNLVITTGLITRWFAAATITGNLGIFPIGALNAPVIFNRVATITSSVAPSVGGTISVLHNSTAGVTSLTPFTDGTATIDRRLNSYWSVTIGNGLTTGATLTLQVQSSGNSSGAITSTNDLRIVGSSAAAAGSSGTNSGTILDPIIQRTGLDQTTIGSSFYVGGSTTLNPLDNPPIGNNVITGPSTVCPSTSVGTINGAAPTGGTGTNTYLWQSSITNAAGGFSSATGTNNTQNYSAGILSGTTWFRRVVTSGTTADTSAALQIGVSGVTNNTIGNIQSICSGATPLGITGSSPAGGSGIYTYSWLKSTASATAGYTLATGTIISINYNPPALTVTTWFRRLVTGGCSDTSAAIQITVSATPYITSNTTAGNLTVCNGATANIMGSAPSGGTGTFTYLWQNSATGTTSGFTSASGTNNTANYLASSVTSNSWYRRVVNSGVCIDTSSALLLSQIGTPISGNSVSGVQVVCSGSTPTTFSGLTPSGGVPAGTRFTEEFNGGALSSNFTLTTNTGTLAIFNSGINSYGRMGTTGSIYANNYSVTSGNYADLDSRIMGPTIAGDSLRFDVAFAYYSSSAIDSLRILTSSGTGFNRLIAWGSSSTIDTVNGITTAILAGNFTPSSSQWCNKKLALPVGTTQIRFEFYSAYGTSLYIDRIIVDSVVPVNYLWQSSITGALSGFTSAGGTNNTQNYAAPPVSSNTWFRRVASSGVCVDTSSTIQVTTNQPVATNTITSSPQTICSGSSASTITGSTPTGGNGTTYSYSWLSSTSSATTGFAIASGTNTNQNYSPGSLTSTTWFRRNTTSGACATDTSVALVVMVNTSVANNTVTGNQTICSGSTPTSLPGSIPTGGGGGVIEDFNGLTNSSTPISTAILPSGWASSLNQNNLISGANLNSFGRSGSTGAIMADNANISNGTARVESRIFNSTITGDSLRFDVAHATWPSYTDTLRIFTDAGAGFTLIKQYLSAQTVDTSTNGITTAAAYSAGNFTPSSTQWTTKALALPVGTFRVRIEFATGYGNEIYVDRVRMDSVIYRWLSSTTSATSGFALAAGNNNSLNYSPAPLTQTTWYRRQVISGVCSVDTSTTVQVIANAAGTWTGTTSTAWNNTANWSCPQLPTSTTNVTIPNVTNAPVIVDAQQANNIAIQTGGSLTLNNAASSLSIYGTITNSGTFTNSTGGLIFAGSSAQTLPAGTYSKVQISNSIGVTLGGAASLNDSLLLISGKLNLSNYNLTLGNNSYASAGSASSYISSNGTGAVIVNNVGSTGKTGSVLIPVGNTTYNPATLTNTGTTDNFTAWVIDSVTNTYTGSVPTGAKVVSNAVNRTWIINEGTAGGSNATVSVQWTAADELTAFTRASSYVGRYTGTFWSGNTASGATGANPYVQSRTGITSFSPFGVGSNGTLPVTLINFSGIRKSNQVDLVWTTASEINNDHFIIERSIDNITFEFVGKVIGNGTTNSLNSYMLNDDISMLISKRIPVVYYKLIQVDRDGKATDEGVVSINILGNIRGVQVNILPNPFTKDLTININTELNEDVSIQVTDVTGRLIKEFKEHINAGLNPIGLQNTDELKDGMYFVNVITSEGVITHKVVKGQ